MNLLKGRQFIGLVAWLALSFAAGAVGSIASIEAGAFYAQLTRPAWAPMPELFAPVWSLLYALMGIAAWLVWRVGGFQMARKPLTLFLVQLAVNVLWSWLFFAWHLGALAFAEVMLLWVLIAATVVAFWRIRPVAGVLLLPYLLWVGFAAMLNYSLWQLNPQLLG